MAKKLKKKKASKKLRTKKIKQQITFDYFRWLAIGFGIASVGIAIAVILVIIFSKRFF